jgi:hypothetical protein
MGFTMFLFEAINLNAEPLVGEWILPCGIVGAVVISAWLVESKKSVIENMAPGLFDRLQLLLVLCSLLVDALPLWAIAARIMEFGMSPNKAAALGENIILLVNLGWSAVLYTRFLTKRASFVPLERWQTAYIPVYAVWAWIVVALFPIIFNYR